MRAARQYAYRDPASLRVESAPDPRPGAGQVLVRVHGAAVTPSELVWVPSTTTREGAPRPLPIIPGHEFSGEVVELGAGVSGPAVGAAVYGINDWYADGASAEYCVAQATDVAPKPASLEHVAAATVPISGLTAWQGLFDRARLAAGERVLIHGGAGAVGVFAVQLARWRGARVLTTVSARNVEFARQLGADEVIDYHARRFEDVARDIDVVFDAVGGDTLERSWSVLKPGGRLVTVAASGEETQDARTRDAFFIVAADAAQLGELAHLLDAGTLRPAVDRVFPLAEAAAAYAHRTMRGKAVLRID
jgi:NADPH:quinone reductase-like Zn-dependent oxidoreductase